MGGDGKTIERELKFPCSDMSEVRERLLGIEAERQAASAFEDNYVFDRNGELTAEGQLLRLRMDREGARLTFKGPATYEDRVRLREEYEVRADSAETVRTILEKLGYEITTRYQKHREEWRIGGVVVALDHTPIGDFAEFEGEGAERVAARCGFQLEEAERRSYLRIYQDYRQEHPEAPADMVFPD